jgi:lysozyme family protein
MGNDPMTAREMIRKSENLSPQARAGLENAVRGEAERVKTQEIAEGIAARFGTDAAGAEKALRYIDGRYKGLERDRIKSEYNFNVAEADRIENMRERENAEAQRKVFLGIAESFVAGERAPSPVEIDRLFADGKISLEQHETLARWQENSVTRAGITKRLSRAAPGWYDMTPQQQEEAVMREAGRTQDDRDATLSYIESAIIDGSLTDAELTAAYNNMYITSSEKEEYKKAIGRYAAYGKEVLGVYKGKLNESLNRVLDNLSGETETSNATLRAIATAAFYEGTVNLDPKDAKYEEKVSEAARAALGAVIDETGEPMTSRSFPKLWETVQSAFAGVAEEAYSNIASGSGIAPPSFRRDPISLIIESEGGYVNNPADRGGETNMGITKATLDAAYKDGIVPHNDVKNLTRQEALEIYKKRYYEPIRYNELPWGVNYMVLDMAVLHGVSGGVKMLQDVLGVKRTGRMDDDTIEAANHALPGDVIAALSLKRRAKFASIVAGNKTQVRFWPGWKNRDKNVREKAMEMAASPDDTARAVLFGTSEDDY